MLACTVALLAVHIADRWETDTWLLYGFMALALLAIGLTVGLNADQRAVPRNT